MVFPPAGRRKAGTVSVRGWGALVFLHLLPLADLQARLFGGKKASHIVAAWQLNDLLLPVRKRRAVP